ncbi:TPA: hypothetical protein HA251_00460 [Candidatus Woesearchaeota archaeon]|nr:hypothetical protein [Candidatus Woesearchaeota archaeon]
MNSSLSTERGGLRAEANSPPPAENLAHHDANGPARAVGSENAGRSHDIFGVMAGRRSTKRFSPHPVELDKVLQIIQAGTLAPSSGNIQNWSFVVITDVGKIRALYHHTLDQDPFLSAMAAVIVCGDVEYAHSMYGMRGKRLYTVQNCAAAIQNMLLAAQAVGLGACWIGAFDEDKVSLMFNIPNHRHRPQAIILFGYAAEEPEPKGTKALESVVFFNEFGNCVLRPHLVFYDWATEWRNQAKNVKEHSVSAWHRLASQRRKDTVEKDASRGASERVSESSSGSSSDASIPGNDGSSRKRSPLELARERIRTRIEGLKREEYRREE